MSVILLTELTTWYNLLRANLANFGAEIDQPLSLAPGSPDTLQLDKADR